MRLCKALTLTLLYSMHDDASVTAQCQHLTDGLKPIVGDMSVKKPVGLDYYYPIFEKVLMIASVP